MRKRRRHFPAASLPPISILKPLKGLDEGIRENLESFFRLQYPEWELIFSVADESDQAVPLLRELMAAYPNIKCRLLIGDVRAGINPKVNNLVRPFAFSRHDWVLISDSNTRVEKLFLEKMASGLSPDTGLRYCVVAGSSATGIGGRLDAMSLNTIYARGTLLAESAGFPCVTGKAMLLKKSILDMLGGIQAFAPEIAEDFVIGQAILRLGHRVEACNIPVHQFVGRGSFGAYWSRTVRWGRIRKLHAPKAIFYSEPMLTSVFSGFASALAASHVFHVALLPVFAAHLALWCANDFALVKILGLPFGLRELGVWLAREFLHPLQWFHIALGDTVEWRGSLLTMERSGILEKIQFEFSGIAIPVRANRK